MRRLFALPKAVVVALALVLMALTGSLDRLTGRDFALSAFYLLPICWTTWAAGRAWGIIMAGIGTFVWFLADLHTGSVYAHPLTPYWNALMLFLFFLIVVCLLAAFQQAHDHLEETVQRRTAALQREVNERKRLEIATLRAERLAVVGTMAAQVAHEIRNPLGAITLNLDLIGLEIDRLTEAGSDSPDEGRALIKEIRTEASRIQRVLEDYLQFARLPQSRREPLDLKSFLDQKLAFLDAEMNRANVRLRAQFENEALIVNADPGQLWQTLLNLIRNSCEAMSGGGEVTIAAMRAAGNVVLRVIDNGKGMTDEQLKRLYEPFFTTKRQGTGLGLALAQQIITEHGGSIECESVPGHGSTFTITLPLADKPNTPTPVLASHLLK